MKSVVYLLIACLYIVSGQLQQKKRQPRIPAFYHFPTPFYPSWGFPNFYPGQISNYGGITEDDVIPSEKLQNYASEAQNVESRVKGGGNNEEKLSDKALSRPESRLFNVFGFVSNPYNVNPFQKTFYQFTSATATICKITSCIPAAQFADAAAQGLICPGRRRRDNTPLLDIGDAINPSRVVRLTPTAGTEELRFERTPRSQAAFFAESNIESSKEEASFEISRTKRNFYYYTSTITTYSFTTTTLTRSLLLGADQALTCRPSDLSVC